MALALRLVPSAALVGLAVTVVEFAAARALAPAYGASNPVWAGIVAIVLLALAVGSGLGGRLHAAEAGATSRVLLFGAAALAVAAFFALRLRLGGPWLTCAVLFAIPLGTCGAAMPALVGALATDGRRGAAAGTLYAANTIGGVVGVVLTPLWALPEHGTERTLLGAAVALLVASALSRRLPALEEHRDEPREAAEPRGGAEPDRGEPARSGAGGRLVALVALGTGAGLLFLHGGPLRTDPGQVLEIETGYQTVRLIEKREAGPMPGSAPLYGPTGEVPVRFLRFDEDTTSYQSVRVLEDEARLLTGGRYYDHLALGAWFEGQPWTRPGGGDPRVLIVGYCGGTIHRVLRLVTPEGRAGPEVLGVELDPAVAKLGRERLGELPDRLDLRTGVDGRTVVNELPADAVFDLILVDAYARTQYVPFQLATLEFFKACKSAPGPDRRAGRQRQRTGRAPGAAARRAGRDAGRRVRGGRRLAGPQPAVRRQRGGLGAPRRGAPPASRPVRPRRSRRRRSRSIGSWCAGSDRPRRSPDLRCWSTTWRRSSGSPTTTSCGRRCDERCRRRVPPRRGCSSAWGGSRSARPPPARGPRRCPTPPTRGRRTRSSSVGSTTSTRSSGPARRPSTSSRWPCATSTGGRPILVRRSRSRRTIAGSRRGASRGSAASPRSGPAVSRCAAPTRAPRRTRPTRTRGSPPWSAIGSAGRRWGREGFRKRAP